MKYLVIVDDRNSAIGLAAHSRAVESKVEILAANEYMTPFFLLKAIKERNPSAIFFAWRGALFDILNCGWRTRQLFKQLNHLSIGILIPDLLGLETKSQFIESKLITFVDFYMVTSKELYAHYSENFPEKLPAGLYRDKPDVKLLQELRKKNTNRPMRRVIWVGNSKWGVHHGAVDHKGFYEIVMPLKNNLRKVAEFKIIDSSVYRQPHERVLREIAMSQVLVQASRTEGTGLPLLEAAGLGTVVVTTDVGIASDFLKGDLRKLIVERNVDAFSVGVDFALSNYQEISKLIQKRFESYVEEISHDSLPLLESGKSKDFSLFSNQFNLLTKLKWSRRWLLAKR